MGKTILVSSHILPELEELCTWIGFIHRGKMLATGPMVEVRQTLRSEQRLRIELVDPDDAMLCDARDKINGHPGIISVELIERGLDVIVGEDFAEAEFLGTLVQAGVPVLSFTSVTGNLSEVFLQLTAAADEGIG